MPCVNRRMAALLMLMIGACLVAIFVAVSGASKHTETTCVKTTEGSICSEFHTGKPEPERDCKFRESGTAKEIIYLETSQLSCQRARQMLNEITPGIRRPTRVQGPRSAWICRDFGPARFPLISRCHRGRQHFTLESFGRNSNR
jgi:hypothetical protein